mgnify:CR=1 FL=1
MCRRYREIQVTKLSNTREKVEIAIQKHAQKPGTETHTTANEWRLYEHSWYEHERKQTSSIQFDLLPNRYIALAGSRGFLAKNRMRTRSFSLQFKRR